MPTKENKIAPPIVGNLFQEYGIHLLILAAAVIASYFLSQYLLRRLLRAIGFHRHSTAWREVIAETRFIQIVSLSGPLTVFALGLRTLENQGTWPRGEAPAVIGTLLEVNTTLFIVLVFVAVDRFIECGSLVYSKTEAAATRPIRGYVIFLRSALIITAILFLEARFLDLPAGAILTGIGAVSGIAALIFRDSLLSFSAGIQLAWNDLVEVGDWIESAELSVDGNVKSISLHFVEVQNWDKTIVSIPTHRLMETTFNNWRGMRAFGGRRFKRRLLIDPKSVKFSDRDLLDQFADVDWLQASVADQQKSPPSPGALPEELTNLDLFQIYLAGWLQRDSRVGAEGTRMVRQLAPLETGALPLEIYCFLQGVDWVQHEEKQSRIYAQAIALASRFELDLFALEPKDSRD